MMYDEIKRNVSITEVLHKYGFRAPARDSFRIACPIHGGRDANFSVDNRNGLWNCFSVCQRGGSVIDLVAALEKIDVKAAVEKLSHDFSLSSAQASTAVARATTSKVERWKTLKKPIHDVQLPDTIELEEGYRGLTRKTIDHWELRRVPMRTVYAPVGSGHGPDPLDQYGSIGFGKIIPSGVLIPLHNAHGGICSYSVRKDEGEPKYWNAPGISRCALFGSFANAQGIINEGRAIVVEGQLDCIGLYEHGVQNCVALMGSSMTETQAHQLLVLTSNILLMMDGDEAGKKASQEITKKWNTVFDIEIIDIPFGKDPDELTREELGQVLSR
jgi:DNA primase